MDKPKTPYMKKGSTVFLKIVLVIMGLIVLTGLIWEPQLEGRNKNSDPISLYFNDPFLAYVYLGSVPFFFALYQAFKLLGYIGENKTFSSDSVMILRNIKYCALTIIGFMAGAMAWVRVMSSASGDDPAGFMAIGLAVMATSTVVAVFATVLQRLFQNAVDIKSENDLTV